MVRKSHELGLILEDGWKNNPVCEVGISMCMCPHL